MSHLSAAQRPTLCFINGSLGGAAGNAGALLDRLRPALESWSEITTLVLAERPAPALVRGQLLAADGFVIATGTYWDSWGSPLQAFLEEMTDLEAGPAWLGKPVATLVTAHSVGGKGVLSRLQGVMSSLGALIPPMSGMVCELATQLAATGSATYARDFWSPADLPVIAANLRRAMTGQGDWTAWAVDDSDPRARWL